MAVGNNKLDPSTAVNKIVITRLIATPHAYNAAATARSLDYALQRGLACIGLLALVSDLH